MTVQELSAQHLQPGDDVKYRGGCVQIYTNPVPFYTRDLTQSRYMGQLHIYYQKNKVNKLVKGNKRIEKIRGGASSST